VINGSISYFTLLCKLPGPSLFYMKFFNKHITASLVLTNQWFSWWWNSTPLLSQWGSNRVC